MLAPVTLPDLGCQGIHTPCSVLMCYDSVAWAWTQHLCMLGPAWTDDASLSAAGGSVLLVSELTRMAARATMHSQLRIACHGV